MTARFCLLVALLTFPAGAALSADASDTVGQKIVDREMAGHPELALLSLHTTPPQGSQSEIVASTTRAKVGKKSDPDDLEVVKTGTPEVKEMPQRQIFDLLFPLRDVHGTTIGTIVMEIKFSAEKTREGALRKGAGIEAEIRRQVQSKEQLFERSQM